ncbi:MEKHLA domain-containing protein [Burkholderia mayonis]|uniref:MEKHLA domain-containing protein n=1 Tax=Burkholderia mayonis TaxID=1385591 RepID=UPI001CF770AE|nr:MEKHLA domain-containing protein [Burkholderia mayonis]
MTAPYSRLSAEHPNREACARLLESVRMRGFATGYRGLRISKSGRRFWIEDVTVWNLIDHEGTYRGRPRPIAGGRTSDSRRQFAGRRSPRAAESPRADASWSCVPRTYRSANASLGDRIFERPPRFFCCRCACGSPARTADQ